MFKGYQWNSQQLRKRAQRYDWFAIFSMVAALASRQWWSANIALVFVGLVILFIILSMRTKNQDKQLQKPK